MTEKKDKSQTELVALNNTLCSQIKEIQKLPENVVVQFLKSKGKLVRSGFAARIKV